MSKQDRNLEKYKRAIARRLELPKELRQRVMEDFSSDLSARLERGQTAEQIITELGTAKKVAGDLNEEMKEFMYAKSPWRWVSLAAAVWGGCVLLFNGVTGFLAWLLTASMNIDVGIIGGADGPTAIFVTSSPAPGRIIVWVIVTVMGIIGFVSLGRLKK